MATVEPEQFVAATTDRSPLMATEPGWYHGAGDPPGTVRYWDGTAWVTEALPEPPGWVDPHQTRVEYGGAGRRVAASLIDGLVSGIFLIPFLFGYIGDVIDDLDAGGDGSTVEVPSSLYVIGIVPTAVFILMVAFLGGTPGKLILGLRVTLDDAATTPPGLGRAVRRAVPNLIGIIPVIGAVAAIAPIAALIMVLTDDQKRSIYDRIGDTRVVRVRR